MSSPTISVIMPTYNYGKYICSSVDSVINQTFSNWELIIIDDCSSDNTIDILKNKYSGDSRISFFKTEKNGGSAVARNLGLDKARGKYICFLDSDDFYDENYLESQIEILEKKNADVVVSSYRRKAKNTTTNFIVPKRITFKLALNGNPMAPLGTAYRSSKFKELRFPSDMKKCEDYVFFLSMLKNIDHAEGNQNVLGTLLIHDDSKSKNKLSLIKWQLKSYKKVGINFLGRYYHLLRWALYGLRKYRNVK